MKQRIVLAAAVMAVLLLLGGALLKAVAFKQSVQSIKSPQQALQEAQNYHPGDRVCATVMTPAIHEQTGVRYTFPSSCIPEGWTAGR